MRSSICIDMWCPMVSKCFDWSPRHQCPLVASRFHISCGCTQCLCMHCWPYKAACTLLASSHLTAKQGHRKYKAKKNSVKPQIQDVQIKLGRKVCHSQIPIGRNNIFSKMKFQLRNAPKLLFISQSPGTFWVPAESSRHTYCQRAQDSSRLIVAFGSHI